MVLKLKLSRLQVKSGNVLFGKRVRYNENHDGIMEIECYAPLGTDIKSIYDIEDTIFEVDNKSLTNRPDLWCHYGFAREVATIF